MQVESYESAAEFLETVDPQAIGCLLLDLFMPNISGLDLLQIMHERGIAIPTIFVTGHGDVATAVRAMKAGAFDYIEKPFGHQELLDRVNQAIAQDQRQRSHLRLVRDWRHRLSTLSDRERQVLSMVVAGRMSKEIATELGVSLKTIERHRSRIMEKVQVGSVAELVRVVMATDPESAMAA
jgi:FixJ family two-component response regulator